jgi:dTDP-4-dehydrorhamnose reductase
LKVLLFGKNGQVGWELQRALAPVADIVALDQADDAPLCGNLVNVERVAEVVRTLRPAAIVNAAAHTAVDKAEGEPQLARAINATGPAALAHAAQECGAWLVHYSTDYVFDGSGSRPWTEEDPTGPLNVYGRTKLEGEQAIRASGCRHLILRTSWVYAARGQNFARTMLRLAGERDELSVIDDQHGAPTGAELLADVTVHALLSAMRRNELGGTYHVAASGATTWYGYARHVIEAGREAGQPIRVRPEAIRPVASTAFKTAAARPMNSRLDTSRFRRAFGLQLPQWTVGVDRMLSELLDPRT